MLSAMHHIVSDGWSMGVLLPELTTFYNAFNEGRESPLPELPLQYVDYAVWQRQWLQGEVLERQLAYWREQLGADSAVSRHFRLTGRDRLCAPTSRREQYFAEYSEEVSVALKRISQQNGVTMFMTRCWLPSKSCCRAFRARKTLCVGRPSLVVIVPRLKV